MKTKYDFVCDRCGSNSIYSETVSSWSPEENEWLIDGFNNYICNDCDNANVDPVKVEVSA